jgi:hypothetical protein
MLWSGLRPDYTPGTRGLQGARANLATHTVARDALPAQSGGELKSRLDAERRGEPLPGRRATQPG